LHCILAYGAVVRYVGIEFKKHKPIVINANVFSFGDNIETFHAAENSKVGRAGDAVDFDSGSQ